MSLVVLVLVVLVVLVVVLVLVGSQYKCNGVMQAV